jgi:hypothetical protein
MINPVLSERGIASQDQISDSLFFSARGRTGGNRMTFGIIQSDEREVLIF